MVIRKRSLTWLKHLFFAGIAGLTLSACSLTDKPADTWQTVANVDFLTPVSSADIRFAQVGEVLNVATQGRQQFEAKVTQRYFAASGRHCVTLQSVDKRYVACEYPTDKSEQVRWGLTRSFGQFQSQTMTASEASQ